MKQFLYLDIDIVNSIIAQSEQGLIQTLSNEQVSSDTEMDSSKIEANINAKLGGTIAKLAKAEADLSGSLESVESDSSTSTSREIISKTMHDAAFDIAYCYINPIKITYGSQSDDDTGNYIEMSRVFDFVDFDYLEGLFEKDGIIDFIKKSEAEQIEVEAEKAKEGYNREQLRKAGINFKMEIKNAVADNNKQYDDIAIIIKALRGLIPYNRMLISNDGYLVPLNTKYFRVDPIDLGFKYGGEITCVGMITNIIGQDTNPNDDKNIFATLQFTANEVLRGMLPTNRNNLCVVHPIAIYYEINVQKYKE
ncbi:MAG: hypothetical protein J1D87_07130 [Lachnospiraceae bacterium]|nr:hypothetical protein [Lachnospiraceae bacterium]